MLCFMKNLRFKIEMRMTAGVYTLPIKLDHWNARNIPKALLNGNRRNLNGSGRVSLDARGFVWTNKT